MPKKGVLAAAIGLLVTNVTPVAARVAHAQVNDGLLEEVVVTARRREESIQEVPTAISAFGEQALAERSIETIANLNSVAPNLSVMGGGVTAETAASFRVRGIPGVAVYVDGVWQSTQDGLFAMGVVDVDRIEVLRGRQGTLFGQTARGGAIHYITRPPADEFGVRLQATVGEYNRRDIKGAVDIPLSDTLKTEFTVASETRDGFLNNVVIDRNYGDVKDDVFRADLLWGPSDDFSLRVNTESSSMLRMGPARVLDEIAEPQYFPATNFNTNQNVQAYWNLGILWNNVNNVSGYIDSVREVQTDFDGAAEVSILERDFRNAVEETSQEFQLLGSTEKIDWVVGAYWWQADTRSRIWTWNLPEMTCDILTGPNIARAATLTQAQRANCAALRAQSIAGGNGVSTTTFTTAANVNADVLPWNDNEGTAYFADVTWRISDKMQASFGYRKSDEDTTSSLGIPPPRAALATGPSAAPAGPAGHSETAIASAIEIPGRPGRADPAFPARASDLSPRYDTLTELVVVISTGSLVNRPHVTLE